MDLNIFRPGAGPLKFRGPDQMLGAQLIFKVPDIYVCN